MFKGRTDGDGMFRFKDIPEWDRGFARTDESVWATVLRLGRPSRAKLPVFEASTGSSAGPGLGFGVLEAGDRFEPLA